MVKLLLLILRNVGRNKVRTAITGLAAVVLVTVFCCVTSIVSQVRERLTEEVGATRLLVTDRWVMPSQFPIRYVSEIAAIPGVRDWTVWHTVIGYFDKSRRSDLRGLAIAARPDNLVEMHPGMEGLKPEYLDALRQTKDGALISRHVLEDLGWRIGQRFTFVNGMQGQSDVELTIVGIMPTGRWESSLFFRDDYYRKAVGDDETVNAMWLKCDDAETSERVLAEIQRRFGDRTPSLKVETESSSAARMIGRQDTIISIVEAVVFVLLLDMAVVHANSIGMTVRERRSEMAVLKVLGFQPTSIMILVIGEAILIGTASGMLGTAIAWITTEAMDGIQLSNAPFMPVIRIKPIMMLHGSLIGGLVGFAGSVIPSIQAGRVKAVDVFSRA